MTEFFYKLFKGVFEFFAWVGRQVNYVWLWFLSFLGILFAPITWALEWFTSLIDNLTGKLALIETKIDTLWSQMESAYPAVSGFFGYANGLFPLSHLFAALTSLFILAVLLAIYRLIKSWIPTLS